MYHENAIKKDEVEAAAEVQPAEMEIPANRKKLKRWLTKAGERGTIIKPLVRTAPKRSPLREELR
jgi:hypothetical protein